MYIYPIKENIHAYRATIHLQIRVLDKVSDYCLVKFKLDKQDTWRELKCPV